MLYVFVKSVVSDFPFLIVAFSFTVPANSAVNIFPLNTAFVVPGLSISQMTVLFVALVGATVTSARLILLPVVPVVGTFSIDFTAMNSPLIISGFVFIDTKQNKRDQIDREKRYKDR